MSYDMTRLRIDPQALAESAQRIDSLAKEVGDAVTRISNTISGLELSWVGPSAQEAQDFSDRWKKVMTQLFGDSGAKKDGVLPVMAGGLKGTAVGFSHTELGLETFFKGMNDALNSGGSGGGTPTSAPQNPDDQNAAIHESFPQ